MCNKYLMILMLFFVSFAFELYAAIDYQLPIRKEPGSAVYLMPYVRNKLHRYTGYVGKQGRIVFRENEKINLVTADDSAGWELEPRDNQLYLRPNDIGNAEEGGEYCQNVVITTNRDEYLFKLCAKSAEGVDESEIPLRTEMHYYELVVDNSGFIAGDVSDIIHSGVPDVSRYSYVNFKYTVSGSDRITPVKAFDTNALTYLEFKRKPGSLLPSVYEVDLNTGKESIINYSIENTGSSDVMIIHKVVGVLTLRSGSDVACVYNEKYLQK